MSSNDLCSVKNMILKLIADKLKLASVSHLKQYNISCFKKGGEILASQRCKIKYSIRKYKDEFYFDILPMDACHLLLLDRS